ncbi:MAG: dipicolinate synthase subunit B [Candidatus Ornithomonoglobus sp.]
MELKNKKIGFAMCGSFCTFKKTISAIEALAHTGADIIPLMSETAYSTDTRFGEAAYFRSTLRALTGHDIIHTIRDAEPIGPKGILDILVILPCTGNTLAKLANGIADSSVTLAAKAHLRNDRPIVIGISTNDALGAAAQNIGRLLTRKYLYFVPFSQDDYIHKPNSLVCDFSKLNDTLSSALDGRQIQPILAV